MTDDESRAGKIILPITFRLMLMLMKSDGASGCESSFGPDTKIKFMLEIIQKNKINSLT